LSFSNLSIEELEDGLDMMPGIFLHELWKYHQRVRSNLTVDLKEFRTSHARGLRTLVASSCKPLAGSSIPDWLDQYIVTIGSSPALFDLTKFHMALSSHVQKSKNWGGGGCTYCAYISHKTIGEFWAALTAVVNGSIANVSN
jgi:hypothetical protein